MSMTARDDTLKDLAEVPGTCASFHLRRADRVITQLYDEALRPVGLKSTQFTLLTAIRLKGPVAINGLAQGMVMDRTTLTRNLRPLEKEGLIRIAPGKDRRVREVSLTETGKSRLKRALPIWRQVQERVAKRLGAERMARLLEDLSATVGAIRQ